MDRSRLCTSAGLFCAAVGMAVVLGSVIPTGRAIGEDRPHALPQAPASRTMGFVVTKFAPPIVPGKDACPDGPVPRLRDAYLETVSPEERTRLKLKENEREWEQRWQAYAFGPGGSNICSNPDMFERTPMRTIQSRYAIGLDLDGDGAGGQADPDGCAQEDFVSPTGERGIDNQEYRALGCLPEWQGPDGNGGEKPRGSPVFHSSGEWTQVILLRGVDSLVDDPDVEVIYANTADRPPADGEGKFLRGASFVISTTLPRERNVLRGRIVGGVLTTIPEDIRLAQPYGQGGSRDLRGIRSQWDLRKGRIRLNFQTDGSLTGLVGGYKPVFDTITSTSIGGAGSALVAGRDCARELATARKLADGLRDPKTGKCTAISTAMQLTAIPAFITDSPPQRTARR